MCHGNEGNGFGSRRGPSLKRQEYKYGRTREAVMESIRHGRPKGMPAYGKLFTEEQLEALTSYVLTLK
jgi:cytochrome c oxidase cbb3-type subunit 3